MEQIAYLRHLPSTNQCELVVSLNIQYQNVVINQEMHSVRQVSDSISSLIEHTKNKLKKVIKDQLTANGNNKVECNYDIPVSFQRKTESRVKTIPKDKTLETFLTENHERTTVTIFDKKFKLLINPPLIKSMHLPSVLYASYTVQPLKFYGLYLEKKCCQFTWYKSKDKNDWLKVGMQFNYHISEEDVDYYLKVVCVPLSAQLIAGPPAEVISQRTVQEFPELPKCPFQDRHEYTKNKLQEHDFRFITYNILSNRYTEFDDSFPYCPREVLASDYRKQLVLKELIGYNADIICLQEMDDREYNNYFNTEFSQEGYISKFHRKGNSLPEGLLCAVRKSRYKLLSYQQLVLSKALSTKKLFEPLYNILKKNTLVKDSFLKQPTSLQICTVKCKEVKRIVVIGNTHLYYHPDATAVRLIQVYMITKYLTYVKDRLIEEWKNFDVDVIFCGDLNSSPNGSVYNFLSNGIIPNDDEFCLQISEGRKLNLVHDLDFVSACGLPKYTNYTDDFKSCLDYIFIQAGKIEVKQIIPLPEEELEQYKGLPNEVYPSDHIALVVDLHFKCTSES